MKYLDTNEGMIDADSAEDAVTSTVLLEQKLIALQDKYRELATTAKPEQKIDIEINMATILLDLDRKKQAWDQVRDSFDVAVAEELWQQAAQTCNVMFEADQADSLAALGQGVWLAVTYPIDPELSVAMLQHIVDETPDDSDGAAVSAVTAHYIADMRATGKDRDDLLFFTNNLLGTVARRHSKVDSQKDFEVWMQKLELKDPALFLPRLRNVIDVMVQDEWWLDREALTNKLPVN